VILAGCAENPFKIAPTESRYEYMYFDIAQDSTETLAQGLQNNRSLSAP
jgi:hypothetical protein